MDIYRFCPKCGTKAERKLHNLLSCPNCGYDFYINPASTNAAILENPKGEILLVKRKFDPMKGHLDLPGGFVEIGESLEASTIREIKEELGLDIKIIEKLGENEYVASDPKEGKKRKHVTYFLAEAAFTEVKLEQKGGLDDARWFRMQDALELNFYEDMLPIIEKAVQKLTVTTSKVK